MKPKTKFIKIKNKKVKRPARLPNPLYVLTEEQALAYFLRMNERKAA